MKLVKRITLIILLILGFSMQCEVFQLECWNFSTAYYLSSDFTYNSEEERLALLEDAERYAKEAGIDIFADNITSTNAYENLLTIYGTENVEKILSEDYLMGTGEYGSIISGTTTIEYKDFSELAKKENQFINWICYIGEKEKIHNIYEKLKEKYTLSKPKKMSRSQGDMVILVWTVIVFIMVVMTCIEILYSKKESVVRISLGQDVGKLILKEMLEEIIADVLLIAVAKGVISQFIYCRFMEMDILQIYVKGIAVSCACYIAYGVYDIKKAFHNVNDSEVILVFSYGLKVVATVLSMFLLAKSFDNIMANALIDKESEMVEIYGEYSYLSIRDKANALYDNNHKRVSDMRIFKNIFRDYYDKATPVISTKDMELDGVTYVCVNEHGKDILGDFITDETILDGVDAVYFIPKHADYDMAVEEAGYLLSMMISDTKNLKIKIIEYDDTRYVSCIDSESAYGMEIVRNPMVVYSNYDGSKHPKKVTANIDVMNISGIMFNLSDEDIDEINARYKIAESGYELVATTVKEQNEAHNSFIKKLIAFCSSMAVFTLLMQLVLIFAVNRMQYRRNAIVISIKKIMGYSIWKRHRSVLCTSVLLYALLTIIMAVIGQVTDIMQPNMCIAVGVIMLVLELAVIIMNIVNVEKKNIQKTLKGGCL